MVENVENLVLEQLRHIRSTVDRMETRLDDLTGRVGRLETSFAQTMGNVQVTLAEHSVRMDRIDTRLTRIEKRLDLVEA